MPASQAAILPGAVRPTKYWIKLQPDLDRFTFQGEERISIEIVDLTSDIVLNAVELRVEAATLNRDGTATSARQITFDKSQ